MTRCARAASLLGVLAFLLSGCGYHTAGHISSLPKTVHVIAVPTFENRTGTYRVEQLLTEAVVREFITRTRFRVATRPGEDADATLRGTVVAISAAPVTFDSKTGRASTALVTMNLRVQLVDRSGKVLFENRNYMFREQYQISRETSSFFQEEGPALDRMARDFGRTLVSNVIEGF